MEVFRITKQSFAGALTASGSANRWNVKGQQVLYTGASRSLATLELVVHKGAIVPADLYTVMVISLPDANHFYTQVQTRDLPQNWQSIAAYATLQRIGSNWVEQASSLILKVPSAVIPFEYNFIINTEHPDFAANVKLVSTEPYFWDYRLF